MTLKKPFAVFFIGMATLVALLSIYGAQHPDAQGLREVMGFFGGFFQLMIPVLAVGALIKYLTCCHHQHNDK